MTAPRYSGRFCIVVIRIIVLWHVDWQTGILVAQIFAFQCVGVIFGVSGDVDLAVLGTFHSVNTGFLGGGDDGQSVDLFNVLAVYRGVAAVRRVEDIIKAALGQLMKF